MRVFNSFILSNVCAFCLGIIVNARGVPGTFVGAVDTVQGGQHTDEYVGS